MSLIPAFELGLWNAWILIVLQFLLNTLFPVLINKETMKKMDLVAPYRQLTPYCNMELCGVAWIIMWHIAVKAEERFLLEKYGDIYREYMNRTPRWIEIPKSEKRN